MEYVSWNNQKWLLTEYSSKYETGEAMKVWSAYTIIKGTEYLILAGTPTNQLGQYKDQVMSVMQSIKFGNL